MESVPEILVLQDKCKKCGTCVQICPLAVFEMKDKTDNNKALKAELCISCGQCVSICAQGAISHSVFPAEKIIPIIQETVATYEQTLELFRSRRSIRAYKDKPVEKELIQRIIEAAFLAPSAENFQCTEFVVIQNKRLLSEISEMTAEYVSSIISDLYVKKEMNLLTSKELHSLKSMEWLLLKQNEGRDMFLFNAPALIIFHSDSNVSYPEASVNLMVQNASLALHSLGLGGFFTGYVVSCAKKDERFFDVLSIPKTHQIYGAVTVGYPKFKYRNRIVRKEPIISWIENY